jgi:hypothetical protein
MWVLEALDSPPPESFRAFFSDYLHVITRFRDPANLEALEYRVIYWHPPQSHDRP